MGRWRASLTIDTITGVMAAAITVPPAQTCETTTAATPDETAAMTSVCSERPSRCL